MARHRRALRAIVCKMWLSWHSPSKLLIQLSAHPGESILGLSAKLCQNVTNGRLLSGFMQAAEDKMAVMLGRHPLNSVSLSRPGPASFELSVFEQALRQKQHRWGARKRFNQRFCIERVLTRHRRALRAIVCKMWLSWHSPSKLLIQLSAHPGESILGLYAKLCQNVTNGRLMPGPMQAAKDKMAVMLARHPLNSESLSRP